MSIADTLHDAINEIDTYLRDDGPTANANLDMHVMHVRDSMELLRCRLDADLQGNQPSFRIYSDAVDPDLPLPPARTTPPASAELELLGELLAAGRNATVNVHGFTNQQLADRLAAGTLSELNAAGDSDAHGAYLVGKVTVGQLSFTLFSDPTEPAA